MGYGERNSWTGLVAGAVSIGVYLLIVAPQVQSRPVGDIDWGWPMLWTIACGIVISVTARIGWRLLEQRADPDVEQVEDLRDHDIARLGERVGQAFLMLGLVAVLVLCAKRSDWFWVANTAYLGLALASMADVVTRVVVYRGGMP